VDAKTDPKLLNDEPDSQEMTAHMLRLMCGINGQAFRVFGNKVLTGPFAQMIVPSRAPWDDGNSGTKLMGVYEYELHNAIRYLEWRKPAVVINVGCAEGYYAIGLARLLKVPVYAFDSSEESLALCEEYAAKNDVKINLGGGVTKPEQLRFDDLTGHRFYLIDCEGGERTLIDLQACPQLADSDLIIECHDFMEADTSRIVADRLSSTHRVELIRPQLPDFHRFDFLRHHPSVLSVLVVTEKRPLPCCWLACWANQRGV